MNIESFNDLPKVESCSVAECSFNKENQCHAAAITVSKTNDPACSTFINSSSKGGIDSLTAGVGACLQASCEHNNNLECGANAVAMALIDGIASCSTYQAK